VIGLGEVGSFIGDRTRLEDPAQCVALQDAIDSYVDKLPQGGDEAVLLF